MLLLLAACSNPPADAPPDTAADVAGCSPTYTIPGALGTTLDAAVDPHDPTFGAPEDLGGGFTIGPDPKHVHLGWPGQDTSRSVSFVWSTDRGTRASLVEWGPVDGDLTLTEGVSYLYGGATNDAWRVHELKLCGALTPSTPYRYRVGGEGHWSPWYTFRSPAPPGSFDTFTLAVAGDSRGAYEDWARVVDAMASHDPDLYLFSGDMVQTGTNQAEWYAWWEATHDRFAEAFLVPAHGNHEFLSSNYFALFSLPDAEQWYTLDYGPLTLAVLNDTVSQLHHVEQVQADFLRDRLGASTSPWKLALHHQSPYAACTRHGSNLTLRALWAPLFDELGVQADLAGHNHLYERSVPIVAEAPSDAGTTYLVTGGAGASLYTEVEETWFNVVANPIEHYLIGEFSGDQAVFTARDLDGNVIDTFTLTR